MDWQIAIDRNRTALSRIILALMLSLGLVNGGELTTLPLTLYRKALFIIRASESALRRVVMMAAYEMQLRGVKLRVRGQTRHSDLSFAAAQNQRLPTFQLIDPLKPFDSAALDFASFGGGNNDEQEYSGNLHLPQYDKRVEAAALGRRLLALKKALDNIPAQARRLTRWYEQRDLAYAQYHPHRFSPLRPGPAMGLRKRPKHEVESVLAECHGLAVMVRSRRDSP